MSKLKRKLAPDISKSKANKETEYKETAKTLIGINDLELLAAIGISKEDWEKAGSDKEKEELIVKKMKIREK